MRLLPLVDGFLNDAERATWWPSPFDAALPPPAKNGAPTIANMNSFEPASFMKTPRGDLILTNGIDSPRLWDGYLPTAWLAGIAAPASAASVATSPGGGASAGTYACYYRFLDSRGQPSSLSPVASVAANAGDKFSWTFLTATSSDGRVTQIELYRSIEITHGSATAANVVYRVGTVTDPTATTFVDALSDDELIASAISDPTSVLPILNPDGSLNANRFTPPPRIKKVGVFFQSRAFYMADVAYNKGQVNVTHGSTTVVGVGAGWTNSFLGDFFYAIGAPAGYEIGSVTPDAGPVTIAVAGNGATNCVQTISFPNQPTAGTWSVSCGAASAAALAWNISAAALQAALEGLSTIGVGGVIVSGSVASGFTLTFVNQNAARPMPQVLADGAQLKGTQTIAVARVQAGGGGSGNTVDQVQVVGFSMLDHTTGQPDAALPAGSAAGAWIAEFRGQGVGIAVHKVGGSPNEMNDGATVTAALESLSSIGAGNCVAVPLDTLPFAGTGQILYQVTFQGALGGIAIQDYITAVTTAVGNNAVGVATVTPQAYVTQGGGQTSGGGSGALNEIQTITLPAGTAGGTWTASPSGCTTAAIAATADGDAVQAALVAACGANYNVTGAAGGPWQVEFAGTLAGHPQSLLTCTSSGLLGVEIDTATTTPGAAAANCVQNLSLGGATAGTFTLTFGPNTTPPLAFNISAADLQTAFTALASVGANNCQVTGGNGSFRFEFTGTLGASAQPAIVCDVAQLTGYQGTSTVTLKEPYGGPTAANVIYCIRPRPEERNQIYFSEDGEPESVPDINTLRLQQYTNVDDEVIGGMLHGPYMYVLMSSHIVRFSYAKLPDLDGDFSLAAQRGAFNQRCWDYVDDTAFLMDSEGAYMFDGAQVEPISSQIEDLWRDGTIDFTASKQFWVKASPLEETVRFGVCYVGETYPQRALCYNYRLKAWWIDDFPQPFGAAVVVPLAGRRRLVYGGANDTLHLSGQGYADGVDSTTETGTMSGTVTSATANTLVDATASFTQTMVGAPVAIIGGRGKGQIRYVASVATTALTFTENWTTQPDATSRYLVGAIKATYRSGILRMSPPESVARGGRTETVEARRAARLAWQPTAQSAKLFIRRYLNHNASPELNLNSRAINSTLSLVAGDPDAVQELQASIPGNPALTAQGFTRLEFDAPTEDDAIVDRWISIELSTYQARDPISIYNLQIQGVD